jgi:Mrp family chromosome partitioning ATPase
LNTAALAALLRDTPWVDRVVLDLPPLPAPYGARQLRPVPWS